MYRKIVWCYITVLTLLDISLNTKLSAQGKSHGNGVSVQESLMEGISLQGWSAEAGVEGGRVHGLGTAAAALTLAPTELTFGRRALAAAHVLHVTITNNANETVHLASVAGKTPDFHSSFFESKTLAPQANTSFSVVYLGRREGLVATHLYIHTSKGLYKYPVSAVGVASEWRVWPLVGLRVPLNATLEPLLTIYNPTDTTIQIREVYSSGAWLGLALPEGGDAAPRAQWTLPPHSTRPLVRLLLHPPAHHLQASTCAYIRIKGNMTGGGLVVGVEAAPAPPGEFLNPLHLRLRTRGSGDTPDTLYVEAGTSDSVERRLHAHVAGECVPGPPHAPHAPHAPRGTGTHNGGRAEASGITVELLRDQLPPLQPLTRAAHLTLNYAKMWKNYEKSVSSGEANGSGGAGGAANGGAGGDVQCAGVVHVGRATLPYSLRLLPGTLLLDPPELHLVRCKKEEALSVQQVTARNHFPETILITHLHLPSSVQQLQLFQMESLTPVSLAPGAAGVVARVQLRAPPTAPTARNLRTSIAIHTNLSDYTLPLLLYEGTLTIEWEWWNSSDGTLRLGTLGTSSTRVVRARLHNPGPAPLCQVRLAVSLPTASASFELHESEPESESHKDCIAAYGTGVGVLRVLAPLAEGALAGAVLVHTQHGSASAAVRLHARHGALHVQQLLLHRAAPYVTSAAPLELHNTMSVRMRVLNVTQPPAQQQEPALAYMAEGSGEVVSGRGVLGRVQYSAEVHCHPHCYTGLQLHTAEGAAWARRGRDAGAAALQADAELQRARHHMYHMYAPSATNYTLHLHTDEVVQVPVVVSVQYVWPAAWLGAGAVRAGLCGVGASVPLRLRARNPARLPLLLQPRLAVHPLILGGGGESEACVGCVWSAASFQLGEWRVTRGAAAAYREGLAAGPAGAPYLLLQPDAEVEFTVTFAPTEPADLAAYFYLRNNLTILERVLLTGRGAHPTFELAGRKPNSTSPILFEVRACGSADGAGVSRRALTVRNTGRVPLRLRGWRLAGLPCQGGAFSLQPCAALTLQPGGTHHLHLHYAADWTRTRTQTTLSVMVGGWTARWTLSGQAAARLVAVCAPPAPLAPLAPFEPQLRAIALCLAIVALIGGGALGAMDAERALRVVRVSRDAQPPRPPLDLRAIGRASPPPAPAAAAQRPPAPSAPAPAAPRRRRTPRARAPDAAAERRAFERWRAGASSPPPSSSEGDGEGERCPAPPPSPPPPPAPPRGDASSSSPDSSPPPLRDSYCTSASCLAAAAEAEASSSSEESSSPGEGRAPPPHAPVACPLASHAPSRGSRQRREGAEARRSERKSAEASTDRSSNGNGNSSCAGAGAGASAASRGAAAGARAHPPRKERAARRRAPTPTPPRALSPAPPRAPPPPPAAAQPPVRWGASWSDVVSRGNAPNTNEDGGGSGAAAPLAPIGSDVRRRLGSHSLFYYGSAPAWPPAAPLAPPAPLPTPDESGGSGYRSLESLWGSSVEPLSPGSAWLWGGGGGGGTEASAPAAPPAPPDAVRPPPGFSAPRPVRPYDPFQSLASIWTPAALDWRLDPATSPPPAAPAPPTPPTPPIAEVQYDPPAGN